MCRGVGTQHGKMSPAPHPLPEGYCGSVSTHDPRVFGPYTWKALHVMANNYPERPTPETQKACEHFVPAIPYMLPCPHCGWHLRHFLQDYQGRPCDNKYELMKFFVEAHNNVNFHTNPSRAPWTVGEAQQLYQAENVCLRNAMWLQAGEQLQRSL